MSADIVDAEVIIDTPGVYDIPEDYYHADPIPGGSLSSSGARKILPPSCPAIFRHEQLHGQQHRPVFDFGHAAHKRVLGVGAPICVVDAPDWRTKAAREQRDAAYAAGHVPVLAAEAAVVEEMSAAILAHPVASMLLDPDAGKPEQSLFWQDGDIWCRARLDFLRHPDESGRIIVVDYKTCLSAEPAAIAKSVASYGYHQQAAFYSAGVRALGLADEVGFLFVCQEKTAPYLVTIAEVDALALRIGQARNEQALEVYAECKATDTWPGHTDDIALIALPAWITNQYPELI